MPSAPLPATTMPHAADEADEMNKPIRPLRLAAAWLVCTIYGCAGAGLWMVLSALLRPDLAMWPAGVVTVVVYASLLVCVGLGLYFGVRLSRRFLSPLEMEVLFRLPRRDA